MRPKMTPPAAAIPAVRARTVCAATSPTNVHPIELTVVSFLFCHFTGRQDLRQVLIGDQRQTTAIKALSTADDRGTWPSTPTRSNMRQHHAPPARQMLRRPKGSTAKVRMTTAKMRSPAGQRQR